MQSLAEQPHPETSAAEALGTTLEFSGSGPHGLTDMVGGGPFELKPGQWTDDTSMALCLAESLLECRDFDPVDQARRYCRGSATATTRARGAAST